jgi:RNA polymerase sigma factor (sigma-70 family)
VSGVAELLAAHGDELRAFVARHGGAALRFESADDLHQGVQLRALERGRAAAFDEPKAFFAWLHAVARSYLADRNKYWAALRRRPSRLLGLTTAGVDPAATGTGPSTFASRKEQLRLAVQAVASLLPRDRDLVLWSSEDVPLEEQAARLGLAYDAAKQARLRALERFRKAFCLASGEGRK